MSILRRTLTASIVAVLAGSGALGDLAIAAEGTPPAAAAVDPAADVVSAWIDGLRRNDLAAAWKQLPPTRQVELADAWHASIARPDRFRDMILDRQLGALADAAAAKELARFLAGGLAQFGRVASGEPLTPPPAPADGQRPDRMQMMQGMMASNALSNLVQGVLADGLETRQVECLESLFADYAAWAKDAGLDDAAKQEAAATHLVAFGSALGVTRTADLAEVDLAQLLTRIGTGLPALKQALAALGLDADALLASATATAEAGSGEERTVVLAFTAFAKPRQLPLKLTQGAAGWSVVADSPLARWLRPAQPRWNGGGRQGRPPGGQPGAGGEDAAPAPAAPPAGNNSF